jgi:hypothetical protein
VSTEADEPDDEVDVVDVVTKSDGGGDGADPEVDTPQKPSDETVQNEVRRAVRSALRERKVDLWLQPYSADSGECTVLKSLVDDLTEEVMSRPELNTSDGYVIRPIPSDALLTFRAFDAYALFLLGRVT